MGYTLIISEKPSAAKKIAESLAEGKVTEMKKEGANFYKINRGGNEIIVAPAVGHLFVLAEKRPLPGWTYPVFDIEWVPIFQANKNNTWSRKYFDNLQSLAKDAGEIISATDYDIEGSVIAFNIIRFICKKEAGKRMKFSTLTKSDLVEAYENASPNLDFPQIEAGLARHFLDYFWGINTSRALTLALKSSGGYKTLSTGRVQGPTLEILEKRQKEIEAFKPTPFWEVELKTADFSATHEKGRFWAKEEAEAVFKKVKTAKEGVVSDASKKEATLQSPTPFDLTTLQREAYNNFGFSPKQTLDTAQSLYEMGAISYPRTSSQKLPQKLGCKAIIQALSKKIQYADLCEKLLSKTKLKPNEGPKEDPAHPSIFPTQDIPNMKELTTQQTKIYDIIVKRFLSVFADPAIREYMTIRIDVNGELFIAKGVRTVKANWLDFYKPYAKFKEQILPAMKIGDKLAIQKIGLLEKQTQPPNRYTQGTILKELEDLELGTKCLTGDCKIITPEWEETDFSALWKTAEYLCRQGETEIRKINSPKTVSLNGGSTEFTNPRLISRRKLNPGEKLLNIKTRGGELRVTEDHPLYLYERGDIILKRAKGMKKGDKLVSLLSKNKEGQVLLEESYMIKRGYKLFNNMYMHKFASTKALGIDKNKLPIRWSSDLAWILGYFYGDGTYNSPKYNGSHQLYFTTTEKKAVKLLTERIKRVFGIEPKAYRVKINTFKVQCNSSIATVMFKLFPEIEGKKIFDMPLDFIGDFLRGYFDADGNVHLRESGAVTINGKKAIGHGVPRIKITLSRKEHIEWIRDLLRLFGINKNIREGKAKLNEKFFRCFTILIGGRDDVNKFAYKIGFDVNHKKRILYKGLLSDSPHYKKIKRGYEITLLLKDGCLDINQIKTVTNYTKREIKIVLKYLVKLGVIERRRLSPYNNPPNRVLYKTIDKDYLVHSFKALYNHIDGDKYYTEALSVDEIEPENQYVYDMSVSENSPNFITNAALLVHNSTRALILQTLYDRGYIREKTIVVTKLGEAVVEALEKYCPDIISIDLTRKFEQGMEAIQEQKTKKEEIINSAEQTLKNLLESFKQKEKDIGADLMKGIKDVMREQSTIGKCPCGGDLVIRMSKQKKRFVGCTGYPKCTQTFSLPHKGSVSLLPQTCAKCGLKIAAIKNFKKRPWKLCVRCGFVTAKTKEQNADDNSQLDTIKTKNS